MSATTTCSTTTTPLRFARAWHQQRPRCNNQCNDRPTNLHTTRQQHLLHRLCYLLTGVTRAMPYEASVIRDASAGGVNANTASLTTGARSHESGAEYRGCDVSFV